MNFKPFDWNVVVRGAWNRAILTPHGIKRLVFDLPKGTSVAVEVALDAPGSPQRVRYEGIVVSVVPGSLVIEPDPCDYDLLDRARQCACRAMTELPRTPFSAAGFNIRYRFEEPPSALLRTIQCDVDRIVSDLELKIVGRKLYRTLDWQDGEINLEIDADKEGAVALVLNFHKGSEEHEVLMAWLSLSMDRVKAEVARVLEALPGVLL